jgi:hypothetical protein
LRIRGGNEVEEVRVRSEDKIENGKVGNGNEEGRRKRNRR